MAGSERMCKEILSRFNLLFFFSKVTPKLETPTIRFRLSFALALEVEKVLLRDSFKRGAMVPQGEKKGWEEEEQIHFFNCENKKGNIIYIYIYLF